MIYEGTNGVQALDLVGRKVMADKGAALKLWSEEVKTFTQTNHANEAMTPFVSALMAAANDLEKATGLIATAAAQKPDTIGAASFAYMQLLGITALTWMWARVANKALDAIDSGAEDVDFYQNKLKTAGFYIAYWTPQSRGLVKQIDSASQIICDFDAADF